MKYLEYSVVFIRTLFFTLFCWIFGAILGVVALPFVLFSTRLAQRISVFWSDGLLWGLDFFCGIKKRIIGSEFLPKGARIWQQTSPMIIVSKHQSAWETIFFSSYFNCPAFIMKKELLWIPLVGIYLKLVNMIVIDRAESVGAMRKIIKRTKELSVTGRPVVIFPEGRRVLPGQREKFKQGLLALVKTVPHVVIVPVAVNSGTIWPKGAWLKKSGTITVKFLPPMGDNGGKQNHLLEKLEEKICEESDALLK
jgi:1-acyl-sn-glycerol-3-phosphate acyltransferase